MNYLLSILAADPVVEAAQNASDSSFLHNWGPLISGLVIAAIGGFWTWWQNRPKAKSDQFQVFMNESTEFREEMRKEREGLKVELLALQTEKRILLEKIKLCEESCEDCAGEVKKYKNQLEIANKEIETLSLKISGLKERVVGQDGSSNGKI